MSERIVDALDRYRDMRDRATETFFMNFYGSPVVQAMAGLRSNLANTRLRTGRDAAREAAEARSLAEIEAEIQKGGLLEAGLRALLYVGGNGPHQGVDERIFAALRQLRQHMPECRRVSLARFKELVKDQYLLLRHDAERAVAAIPALLPDDLMNRQVALQAIRTAAEAAGELPEDAKVRLSRIERLFEKQTGVQPRPGDGTVAQADGSAAKRPVFTTDTGETPADHKPAISVGQRESRAKAPSTNPAE